MRRINVLSIFAVVVLSASVLSAQATRTWVSGVGDDANPCSRTAPCKTWAGAIAKTVAGGEIDALDPGGFGALTITKPITLDGGGGQVASVLVAGTNGITVAAGAGDTVIIRNLRLDGLMCSTPAAANCTGSPGLTGISFISGKNLVIENCVIFGFTTAGISASVGAAANLTIANTVIENIGNCVAASCTAGIGDGIFAKTTSGTLQVQANNTQISRTANNGVEAGGGSIIAFENGVLTNGNNGATATTGGFVDIGHSTIDYNAGTAYNAAGGSIFVPATVVSAAVGGSVGTNVLHDIGAVGTATYFLLK